METIAESLQRFDESREQYAEILADLNSTGVKWALAGGLALAFHGYSRYTKDVDILVNKEDIRKITEHPSFQINSEETDFTFAQHIPSGVHVDILKGGTFFPTIGELILTHDDHGTPIVSIEDLIILKMARGDPSDQGDIYRLLQSHQSDLATINLDKIKSKVSQYAWSKIQELLNWTKKPEESSDTWSFKKWFHNLIHGSHKDHSEP